MNIKHYITKQFLQVQQPVESDPKEYEYGSNNSITAQDKSTVNKKPRFLSPTTPSYHQTLQREYGVQFGNHIPTASQIEENMSTWKQLPAQNPAKLASLLIEGTAILQSIGSSNKRKQLALASRKHLNT
ncbi:hypothetical protein G9A89_012214 [Geosiphon pyriformis]|nr:hypothetical protein G9A89_012214 [Geosiphon pyriformis]